MFELIYPPDNALELKHVESIVIETTIKSVAVSGHLYVPTDTNR